MAFANSQTRNPTLVSLLEVEGIAENQHSGIPAIREEAKQCGYKPVEFQDQQTSFTVRFCSLPEQVPTICGQRCLSRDVFVKEAVNGITVRAGIAGWS